MPPRSGLGNGRKSGLEGEREERGGKNCVQDSGKRSSFGHWRRVEHARDAWFPEMSGEVT